MTRWFERQGPHDWTLTFRFRWERGSRLAVMRRPGGLTAYVAIWGPTWTLALRTRA